MTELETLRPPEASDLYPSPPASPHAAYSSAASCSHRRIQAHPPPRRDLHIESDTLTHADGSPLKLNERPISWEIHERDRTKLKIQFLPLTIQIDPHYGTETFSYPSWDRYQVSRA